MASKKELLQRRKELLLRRRELLVQGAQETPAEPTFRDRLQALGEGAQALAPKITERVEAIQPALSQAQQTALQTSPAAIRPLVAGTLAAREKVGELLDIGGEKTAETIAERFPDAPPELAALAGTGVALTDELVEALTGFRGGRLAGTAKPRFSTKAIGREIGAAEKAVGVTDVQVVTQNIAEKLGLPKAKRRFNDVANEIERKIKAGEPVDVQTLADFRTKAGSVFEEKAFKKGTKARAILTRQKKVVDREFNRLIPERVDPARRLARAQAVRKALGIGAAGAALEFGRRKLGQLFGQR